MPTEVISLSRLLSEAGRLCPGITDALLVDADGVLIETVRLDDSGVDPDEVAVEGLAAAVAVSRFSAASRLGTPSESLITGEHGVSVIRRVEGADAVVILRAGEDVLAGRVRFAARIIAGRLAPHLAG